MFPGHLVVPDYLVGDVPLEVVVRSPVDRVEAVIGQPGRLPVPRRRGPVLRPAPARCGSVFGGGRTRR